MLFDTHEAQRINMVGLNTARHKLNPCASCFVGSSCGNYGITVVVLLLSRNDELHYLYSDKLTDSDIVVDRFQDVT